MNTYNAKKEEKVTIIQNVLKNSSYIVREELILSKFFYDIVQKGEDDFDISLSEGSIFLKTYCNYHKILPNYRFIVSTIEAPFEIEIECRTNGCLFSVRRGNINQYSHYIEYVDPFFDCIVAIFLDALQSCVMKNVKQLPDGAIDTDDEEYIKETVTCIEEAISQISIDLKAIKALKEEYYK